MVRRQLDRWGAGPASIRERRHPLLRTAAGHRGRRAAIELASDLVYRNDRVMSGSAHQCSSTARKGRLSCSKTLPFNLGIPAEEGPRHHIGLDTLTEMTSTTGPSPATVPAAGTEDLAPARAPAAPRWADRPSTADAPGVLLSFCCRSDLEALGGGGGGGGGGGWRQDRCDSARANQACRRRSTGNAALARFGSPRSSACC